MENNRQKNALLGAARELAPRKKNMLTQPHAARAQDGPDPDRLCPGGGPLSAVSGGTLGRGSGARVSFHESAKVLAPAAPLSCARALVRPPEQAWRPAVVRCSARCKRSPVWLRSTLACIVGMREDYICVL